MAYLVLGSENGYKAKFQILTTIYCGIKDVQSTIYGDIFDHRNRFAAVGHKNPDFFEPGIWLFMCGARLLAPT